MNRFIIAILFALLLTPAVFAREQTVLARVTVYWASSNAREQQAAYNGARLRVGHCAVDPDKIPYGSKVVFADGAECKAIDTGPAVVSRKAARLSGRNTNQREAIVVDRYFDTKEQALVWADTHPHFMTLRVVTPGSDKKQLPERETMLAKAGAASTSSMEAIVTAIHAPSGLQTADATAAVLLSLIPFLRVARRRMIHVRPRFCYA